ncbi:MAG: molybdopterin-dependent oxidoreductase [Chloroflexi bacterium]|nr:molybdopterin-dependent oxidoreductase [Chloroflexota bacterium]
MTGGAIAGAVAMAFALLVAYLLSAMGVPYPPVALGQAVIEVLPGWISVPLIELLQFWAQRLLVAGVIALYVIAGATTGVAAVTARAATALVVGLGALPWVATVVLAQLLAGPKIDLGADLLGSAVGAGAFFGGLASLLAAERVATPAALGRRRALFGALAAAGVVALASTLLGGAARAARARIEPVALAVRRLRTSEPVAAGDPAFEGIARLTSRVTANEAHYTVDTALIKPRVDAKTWSLEIAGAVERPYRISYDELLDLEAVERPHTLECISNEIGGDLISTAVWVGVSMADLLARAAPKADAYDTVLTSVDGYSDSIRIAKALDPDTLVAYLMNGVTLPEEHGFPARALIPGIYGMKNVKWLRRIEVVPFDFQGYWMERGWSDVAAYHTHVRIDTPTAVPRLVDGSAIVAGIAFAGQRGISKVEISTDGGKAWNEATLEAAPGRHTWLRWRYLWRAPAPARYRVVARATDGTGQVQTSVQRPPFPDGSSGYHAVEVSITA